MFTASRSVSLALLATAMLLTACASKGDMRKLNGDVQALQTSMLAWQEENNKLRTDFSETALSHPVIFTRGGSVYDVIKSVVQLRSDASELGSGVLIASGEILTAYHVLGGRSGVDVTIEGVGARSAQVTGYDSKRDLALLKFSTGTGSPTIASLLPQSEFIGVGDSIVLVGFGDASSTYPMATFGHITQRLYWTDTDRHDIGFDAIINPGVNGGGVFDSKGYLVGMVQSTLPGVAGLSYAVTMEDLYRLLPDLRAGNKR